MVFVAQRVAGGDIFNFNDSGDVARVAGLDILAFIRLDLNQTRNAFTLVRAWIVNSVALRQGSGINTKEYQLPDKRITPKFECERTEISVVVRGRSHRLVRVRLHPFGRRNVERA